MKKSIKTSAGEKQVLKQLKSGRKTFQQVRKIFGEIDEINCGGCGVAALAMYDAAKREGKNPKIVFAWDVFSLMWGDDSSHHWKYKKGLVKTATSCSHVMVKIGNKYYDSRESMTGKEFEREFRRWDKNVSRKHLVAALNNRRVWNSEFDRDEHLPEINKKLGYKLLEK